MCKDPGISPPGPYLQVSQSKGPALSLFCKAGIFMAIWVSLEGTGGVASCGRAGQELGSQRGSLARVSWINLIQTTRPSPTMAMPASQPLVPLLGTLPT